MIGNNASNSNSVGTKSLYDGWVLAGSNDPKSTKNSKIAGSGKTILNNSTTFEISNRVIYIQATEEISSSSLETSEKALKEFEKVQGKFENVEVTRTASELSLKQAVGLMDWFVNGPKFGDKSEGSTWYEMHHKVPKAHMERMEKALEIMGETAENIELPLILGVDGYRLWSVWKELDLQDSIVSNLKKEVGALEEESKKNRSLIPELKELQVKLAGEEEKLDNLKNKMCPEQCFSFMATLGKAMMNKLGYIWDKLGALNKAGKIHLPLTEMQISGISFGCKGAAAGVKIFLALRNAYKLIKEEIIPLHEEVKILESKIAGKAIDPRLREELTIRKIFLKSCKAWEIAKKAFFTLMEIGAGGLGIAEFAALTVLGIGAAATPLMWIGVAIMATTLLISAVIHTYEQSPRLENWFEQRSLRGRVKVLEHEKEEISKKSNETVTKIKDARDLLLHEMKNSDQMLLDRDILGFQAGGFVTKEEINTRYEDLTMKALEKTAEKQKEIYKLKATMQTMDKIAQERVFCRKKRMDYETWRQLVINVKGTMDQEDVKAYRLCHLVELSNKAKTTTEYDRYRRYVHHFALDPVKAWLAYLTNDQFESLQFRDPNEAELNIASLETYAWDRKSSNAYLEEEKNLELAAH